MTENLKKEKGSAEIIISLSNGVITVRHEQDNVILAQWTSGGSDWEKLWDKIRELENGKETF